MEQCERLMNGSCIEADGLEAAAGNLRRGDGDGQTDYTMSRAGRKRRRKGELSG